MKNSKEVVTILYLLYIAYFIAIVMQQILSSIVSVQSLPSFYTLCRFIHVHCMCYLKLMYPYMYMYVTYCTCKTGMLKFELYLSFWFVSPSLCSHPAYYNLTYDLLIWPRNFVITIRPTTKHSFACFWQGLIICFVLLEDP